ncbi:MAG: hypothetical protein V4719_07195 [Planctomycetota bacterium]
MQHVIRDRWWRLAWGLLIVAASFGQPSLVMAELPKPPLDIQVDRLYPIRSDSPVTLLVTMTPNGSGLLEGKLRFKLWNGGELLTTVTTDDEVINPPSKKARYMLPAPDLRGYAQQLDLTVEFISKNGPFKLLGPFSILAPLGSDRDLVIGYVAPETMRLDKTLDLLLDELKFENFSPIVNDRSLRTINDRISPEQLPTDGISMCAFNMLFIAAEGFSAVKESQWTPIVEWVEAGGSLCLLPTNDLSPHHVVLLNKLLESKNPQGTYLLGPNSELLFKNEQQRKISYHARRGLGRVAVVNLLDDETLDPKSAEWRATIAHLWNFRRDQVSDFVQTGQWNLKILAQQEQRFTQHRQSYLYQNIRHEQKKLGYLPLNSGDQLMQAIVPSNLHIIPLPLIAFVLFLYVLAIGPGDYFILGRFNLRKWTWVTFPLTTVIFAAGALWMAEWYMNTGDARRSVYFVDIGVEGRAERVNQLEMLFNSRQKVVETPLTRSLFTSLDHQMYGAGSYQQFNQRQYGKSSGFVGPAEISGRIPSRFVAYQLTPKWVPQLNRIMTLNTDKFANKMDWQKLQLKSDGEPHDWEKFIRDRSGVNAFTQPIKAEFTSGKLTIGVYSGGQYYHLFGNRQLFSPIPTQVVNGVAVPQPVGSNFQNWNNSQQDFLADVSMLQDAGLFSVVSRIAPHGGRQLEDLSLVDPSDPRQWLLMVGIEEDQDWIVYRKLYAGIE